MATSAKAAPVDEPASSARCDTYTSSDGKSYFALSLRPAIDVPVADRRDVVVLVDTSASQGGAYRDKALAALDALLSDLGPHDRVQIMAVDLNAVPMSTHFAAPESEAVAAAREKLNRRVPLGSTDMIRALSSAADAFEGSNAPSRAIVYLGDGMSRAKLLGTRLHRDLVAMLVERRLPVSSYAVGPETNGELLAALANQTGGNLAVASSNTLPNQKGGVTPQRAASENVRNARKAGAFLAAAVNRPVLWPASTSWPEQLTEHYPRTTPPLRTDRDTIIIGSGELPGSMKIAIDAETAGRRSDLVWNVVPRGSDDDNAYLVRLVGAARRDAGASLTTLGNQGLQETRRLMTTGTGDMAQLARHALSTGSAQNARLLASEALRRDPGNPTAQGVLDSTSRAPSQLARHSGSRSGELRLIKAQVANQPRDGELLDQVAGDGQFLDQVEQQNRVIEQMIQAQVETELEAARDRMGTDPEGVIQTLKLVLAHVRRAPEINPDLRSQLIDQLESALKEASRREVELENEQQLAQESEAAARERRRIVDQLTLKQQKIKQLMDRMNALMDEGRYREAEVEIGPELFALDPTGTTPVSAVLMARLKGNYIAFQELRIARWNGFYGTLLEVERSSIPFPDEPPIVYPDAPVWEELTHRRKKYASVDLKKRGGAEEKIAQALDDNTNFEFIETPLRDVVEYLKDLHDIEIQIDQKALDDVGIGTETPITRNLKGITLRSALRLMLRELDLTYTIQDEVLLITTPEVVENLLTTKVYPVADLVLPIADSGFQGGFGGLGGFGGGGQQGGGGGQGFGQGGGFGGGGIGGGGGGQGGAGGGFF